MNIDQVFVSRRVVCPACGAEGTMRYPNPEFYTAGKRESDLHVVDYTWSVQGCEGIVPHFYSVWQCPQCLFADLCDKIENPDGSFTEEHLIEAFREIPDDMRSALETLHSLVPEGNLDRDGAIALHLAALLIAHLPPKERIDHGKLGRVALRLAWLYRERGSSSLGDSSGEGPAGLVRLKRSSAKLESRLQALSEAAAEAVRATEARTAELGISETGGDNPYTPIASALSDKLEEVETLMIMLQSAIAQDGFGDFEPRHDHDEEYSSSLKEVMLKLTKFWPEAPQREGICLRLAAEAFEQSYNNQATYQSIEQTLVILGLMVEILIRINRYEQALRIVAEISKSGTEHKQELSRRITDSKRSRNLRAHDERLLNRKIATINSAIERARKNRIRIIEILMEKHSQTIEKVLERTANMKPEMRAKALREAGVPEEAVRKLESRGFKI